MRFRSLVDTLTDRQHRGTVVVSLIVVIGLIWWWFPALTDESADTDVAIVSDSFLFSAEREVTYRIHEDGFSLVWAPQQASWCDAPAAVSTIVHDHDPATIVVSFADEGSCGTDPAEIRDQVAAAAGDAKLIVVANPATVAAAPPTPRAVSVDPSRLLGPVGTIDQGCLWWDTCRPDGRVDVRAADGSLVPSGQTRVARMIVTALR